MLKSLLAAWSAPHRTAPFPPVRRLVGDLLHEAKRKHNIYEFFEADITDFMAWRAANSGACSVTAFVLTAFARAIQDQPEMQAGRSAFGGKLIIFDEVDVSYTVEKEIDGGPLAWAYIIRNAGRKSAADIESALQKAKAAPLVDSPHWKRAVRLASLPRILRRMLWLCPRFSPFVRKRHMGSVGVTSVGMFSKGGLTLLPLSPLTLTLSIGAIEQKLERHGDAVVTRDGIALCLIADHDIIDGAPLARFAEDLRARIADPQALLKGD